MPYPTFSAAGVTTVTFSRGNVYGTARAIVRPQQVVGRSYAGTYRVATVRAADSDIPLIFQHLPHADYLAVLAFLGHPLINYAANPFTYTDVDGVAALVRYLASSIELPEVAAGLYSWSMSLSVEVTT